MPGKFRQVWGKRLLLDFVPMEIRFRGDGDGCSSINVETTCIMEVNEIASAVQWFRWGTRTRKERSPACNVESSTVKVVDSRRNRARQDEPVIRDAKCDEQNTTALDK